MTVKEGTPVNCNFNDEPLYNQVVGRLIVDGIYAPIAKYTETTAK